MSPAGARAYQSAIGRSGGDGDIGGWGGFEGDFGEGVGGFGEGEQVA